MMETQIVAYLVATGEQKARRDAARGDRAVREGAQVRIGCVALRRLVTAPVVCDNSGEGRGGAE